VRMLEIPTVVVFAKAPIPGFAKTRLLSNLTPNDAADLAACFAEDVIREACCVCGNVMVAVAGERRALEAVLPGGLIWKEQPAGDLGERLDRVLREAFATNFAPIVVIGTDSPSMPPEYLSLALTILDAGEADCVLGPADDGGYYLIGLRHPVSGLFDDVAWSTPQTYAQTVRNANRLSLRLHVLPAWYDVDTILDLRRLEDEIACDPELRARIPKTSEWLSTKQTAPYAPAFRRTS